MYLRGRSAKKKKKKCYDSHFIRVIFLETYGGLLEWKPFFLIKLDLQVWKEEKQVISHSRVRFLHHPSGIAVSETWKQKTRNPPQERKTPNKFRGKVNRKDTSFSGNYSTMKTQFWIWWCKRGRWAFRWWGSWNFRCKIYLNFFLKKIGC